MAEGRLDLVVAARWPEALAAQVRDAAGPDARVVAAIEDAEPVRARARHR